MVRSGRHSDQMSQVSGVGPYGCSLLFLKGRWVQGKVGGESPLVTSSDMPGFKYEGVKFYEQSLRIR